MSDFYGVFSKQGTWAFIQSSDRVNCYRASLSECTCPGWRKYHLDRDGNYRSTFLCRHQRRLAEELSTQANRDLPIWKLHVVAKAQELLLQESGLPETFYSASLSEPEISETTLRMVRKEAEALTADDNFCAATDMENELPWETPGLDTLYAKKCKLENELVSLVANRDVLRLRFSKNKTRENKAYLNLMEGKITSAIILLRRVNEQIIELVDHHGQKITSD